MSVSNDIRTVFQSLTSSFQKKYRGKFTTLFSEFSVSEELQNRNHSVQTKAGQGRYDLLVDGTIKARARVNLIPNARGYYV